MTGVNDDWVLGAEENLVERRWAVVVNGERCVELVGLDNLRAVLDYGLICVV